MIRIRARLAKAGDDEGMSLIEVVVALMVFTVIALGVGASSLTILRMTEDTRARQVASNLATSELDAVRGLQDPFKVPNDSREVVVSGVTYTIARSTSWVDTSGADVGCGTGTGLLKSKRVNVEVTWAGMLSTTKPVRSDTLISPENRINDPNLGTIRISVLNAGGTGFSGVNVTIAPVSGSTGAALDEQPAKTDSDGCSFALKVKPGSYTVTIARTGAVSTTHATTSSSVVTVAAGGSVAVPFQYDLASTFTLNYANNYVGPVPKLPTDLHTTYFASSGSYVEAGRKAQTSLFPVTSGYVGIAGKYLAPVPGSGGCVSVDPLSWSQGTVGAVAVADGARPAATPATADTVTPMGIPMGVVTVKAGAVGFLTAVSAAPPAGLGDPGCATPMTYSFGSVLINGSTTIALPFGSWTLSSSTTQSGTKNTIVGGNITLNTLGTVTGNTVTLDPRLPR